MPASKFLPSLHEVLDLINSVFSGFELLSDDYATLSWQGQDQVGNPGRNELPASRGLGARLQICAHWPAILLILRLSYSQCLHYFSAV